MISIELDIFSGRPNPRWSLSEEQVKELVDRVKADSSVLLPLSTDAGGLGYRGFVVRYIDDGTNNSAWQKAGLPPSARISRKHNPGVSAAQMLLQSATATPVGVDDSILAATEAVIQDDQATAQPSAANPDRSVVPLAYTTCAKGYYTSDTNFSFWNDPGGSPSLNNCYNFAANLRNNTFAQPGRASGSVFTQFNCFDVGSAAQRDGWQATCRSDNNLQTCLVIWPGVDFHWYRLCANGHWCHKPGVTNARNTDNSGNLITNPETRNRGNYTSFCGYYRAFNITVS